MPRLALLLLLAAVAGCDTTSSGGGEEDRFLGTWERDVLLRTTVVSTVAQRYEALDVVGTGGIEVWGAFAGTLRYFVRAPDGGRATVEDRLFTALTVFPGRGVVSQILDGASERVDLPSLTATVGASPATLSVSETTVETSAGPLTVGGTLTARAVDLPAGAAATLPVDVVPERYVRSLRITAEGVERLSRDVADPAAPPVVTETATWDAEGDAITLTFTSGTTSRTETLRLEGGFLVRSENSTSPPTSAVEDQKGLARGSLSSATQQVTYRYTREG